MFVNRDVVSMSVFANCSAGFMSAITNFLQPQICLPTDHLMYEGDMADEMYFVRSGSLEVRVRNRRVAELGSGSIIGEVALVLSLKRTASVVALTFCSLFMLRQHDFEQVCELFPDDLDVVKEVANERHQASQVAALGGSKLKAAANTVIASNNFTSKMSQIVDSFKDKESAPQGQALQHTTKEGPSPARAGLSKLFGSAARKQSAGSEGSNSMSAELPQTRSQHPRDIDDETDDGPSPLGQRTQQPASQRTRRASISMG